VRLGLDVLARLELQRGGRHHAEQLRDGARGLALGHGFEPLAQQDEGDEHRRRLELLIVAPLLAARDEGHHDKDQRVAVRGEGAERYEHVHVEGAVAQRGARRAVEGRTKVELDGRGEHPEHEHVEREAGRDVCVQPVADAGQVLEHHREQEDRQCQQQAADEAAAPLTRLAVEGVREVCEVVAGHHLRLVAARDDACE